MIRVLIGWLFALLTCLLPVASSYLFKNHNIWGFSEDAAQTTTIMLMALFFFTAWGLIFGKKQIND